MADLLVQVCVLRLAQQAECRSTVVILQRGCIIVGDGQRVPVKSMQACHLSTPVNAKAECCSPEHQDVMFAQQRAGSTLLKPN